MQKDTMPVFGEQVARRCDFKYDFRFKEEEEVH